MTSSRDDFRISTASLSGGLLFPDPKEAEMLRRSLQYLVARVGGNVMAGNINFTKMSMPVHLNEPRSLLQRITDDWAYAPYFLPAAAATTDPIRRINLVAAFVVSGLHCVHTLGKPFNPILGSTYQAKLQDGTPCYVEQTSHHPPVTHYTIRPPDGKYILAGFSGIDGRVAWGLDTALSSRRIGINVVQFQDGSRIVYSLPRMLVRGLATERKVEYVGPFSIFYEQHGLVFDILLDPPQPHRWSPFRTRVPSDYLDGVLYKLQRPKVGTPAEHSVAFSGAFARQDNAFFGNPDGAKFEAEQCACTPVELRSDEEVTRSVTAAIEVRNNANKDDAFDRKIITFARGTFLGYFDVAGERVWDIRNTPKSEIIPNDMDKALRSDCRHREDIVVLRQAVQANGDNEEHERLTNDAQMIKEGLENRQRLDRKWRREGLHPSETEPNIIASSNVTAPVKKKNGGGKQSKDGKMEAEQATSDSGALDEPPFFPPSLGGL